MSLPWAAVLFDLDGTLADTEELILHCFRHTMEVHHGEVPEDGAWLAGFGIPLREQLRRFARNDEEGAAMLDTYVTFQSGVHDDMVSPFPGAVEVLAALRMEGVALGVVTSKRSEMARRTLSLCGLDGAYDILVGADDVVCAKPDPEPVQLALGRLGLRGYAKETLFVGDSPFDVRSGRAAGTYTAAALWGPSTGRCSWGRRRTSTWTTWPTSSRYALPVPREATREALNKYGTQGPVPDRTSVRLSGGFSPPRWRNRAVRPA